MRRPLAGLVILLAAGAAVWLILRDSAGPDAPLDGVRRDAAPKFEDPTLAGAPHLETGAPTPSPSEGPGSIAGTVRRGQVPARARIEVRVSLREADPLAPLLALPYSDEEPVAVTESGADGGFLVRGLPIRNYEVVARSDDGRAARARVRLRDTRPNGRAWLDLGGGKGVLVARAEWEDTTPFEGIVYARVTNPRTPRRRVDTPYVASDEQGRFRLPGLPDGQAELVFVVPGESRSVLPVVLPVTGEPVFVLDEGVQVGKGVVLVDGTDEPIAGAEVISQAWSEEQDREWTDRATSRPDGSFTHGVLGGKVKVRAWAEGYEPGGAMAEAGEPVAVRLQRRGLVTGRVVEAGSGAPVAAAPVRGWNWYSSGMKQPLATSAEDGTFAAEVGPGKGMLYVLGGGWVSEDLSEVQGREVNPLYVSAAAGETTEVVLEVVPAGRAEGTVTDVDGRPLPNTPVLLMHPERWQGFRQTSVDRDTCAATTDASGRYALEALVPTFPYRIEALPPGGLPARSKPLAAASGETLRVDLQVPVARWLPVRVVEPGSGVPVEGATVSARQAAQYQVQVTTGADGTARLGPLLPEVLTLDVRHAAYVSRGQWPLRPRGIQLDDPGADPEELVVELEKGAFVAGRVRGVPPPGDKQRYLGVYREGQSAERGLGLSGLRPIDGDGPFRIGPLTPGTYDVALVEKDVGFNYTELARWTVVAGREDLVLDVEEGRRTTPEERFVVKVTDAQGRPVVRAWVRVLGKYRSHVSADFVRDGEFVLKGATWGGVVWIDVIEARDADGELVGGVLHGPVELAPGVVEIKLAPPVGLRVRVLAPDGKPVPGLAIHVDAVLPETAARIASTFALPRGRTETTGRLTLSGLGPGSYRLLLKPPPAYALKPPPVVGAGEREVVILLEAAVAVDVVVRGPDDAPLEGAKVTARLPGFPELKRETTTNAEGVAHLSGLDRETRYTLTVEQPVGREGILDHHEPGWRPIDAELYLGPGDVIEGTVREEGRPRSHATVWWKDARGHWRKTGADEKGRFRIWVSPDGKIALQAARPGSSRRNPNAKPIEVEPGATNVVLDL